jgi:hypothetical protein
MGIPKSIIRTGRKVKTVEGKWKWWLVRPYKLGLAQWINLVRPYKLGLAQWINLELIIFYSLMCNTMFYNNLLKFLLYVMFENKTRSTTHKRKHNPPTQMYMCIERTYVFNNTSNNKDRSFLTKNFNTWWWPHWSKHVVMDF